jgi:hypothetical protein
MAERLIVGPIDQAKRTGVEPFNIDSDSFPTIVNMYQWRGRIKRKRGTDKLGQLQRWIGTTSGAGNLVVTINPHPITEGISVFKIGTDIFTDPGGMTPVVTLITNGSGSGTLNLTTGVLTITGSIINTAVVYIPQLPVLGLEELQLSPNDDPGEIGFDNRYSYNIDTVYPYTITDVSYYKNPASSGTYVQKGTWTPIWWNGQDYQQFWTTNYEGGFWATNGVKVPFDVSEIGMQFKPIKTVTVLTPTTATLQITGHGLVVGDFVFVNEVLTTTGINFQTGYVTTETNANNVIVTFPNATITTNGTLGIAQYLTSRSNTNIDCIRYYDGPPTDLQVPPAFQTGHGWVNYMPPLSEGDYSIANLPADQYYLVGAKMILPFKDRLIFFGPVVQSSTRSPVYLQDTIIYSQNGTPYYTASYTNTPSATKDTPTSITNQFTPLLVPDSQTATPTAMFEDQVGFGGFLSLGLSDRMISAALNEDVIIVGFTKLQTRLVSTGNDVNPFEFYRVNSELGTGSTFSTITMDQGVLSRGNRGMVLANQVGATRFDLNIPDQIFQINTDDNGAERFTAQRDFVNEWVYFTYPSNQVEYKFPNQTLFYNYRDQSFSIFNECYTTYGTIIPTEGETWATLGVDSWDAWNSPWNSGDNNPGQLQIIAGNQQGYVMFKSDKDTDEEPSLYINNILGNTVTSPNHCLNNTDYIVISGATGSGASLVNGLIFMVTNATTDTFELNPIINMGAGAYLGGAEITRLYVPFVQNKQFPIAWNFSRKTRIGPQQYLLSKTDSGQITVQIYLSQDSANPYNDGPIVPAAFPENSGLIYSQIVYTCPESTNLGLTPANINLNTPTANTQAQIWHRMNTSLIGDTVQLGFTLSDEQMRDTTLENQFGEIELHGFIIEINPSSLLC